MPDRADLLRRIDAALNTPRERVHASYALALLREARAELADAVEVENNLLALIAVREMEVQLLRASMPPAILSRALSGGKPAGGWFL